MLSVQSIRKISLSAFTSMPKPGPVNHCLHLLELRRNTKNTCQATIPHIISFFHYTPLVSTHCFILSPPTAFICPILLISLNPFPPDVDDSWCCPWRNDEQSPINCNHRSVVYQEKGERKSVGEAGLGDLNNDHPPTKPTAFLLCNLQFIRILLNHVSHNSGNP